MTTSINALVTREFLDAAASGDVEAVDAWLASDLYGDVNAVGGEGWTALHYAASRSQLRVVQRLVVQSGVDLNATTVTGSSALVMALKHKNNALTRLLLTHGASRYTIHAHMAEALASTWMQPEVKHMLSPQWSVCWSPILHAHFPVDQREKCRLVVFANTLALRRAVPSASRRRSFRVDSISSSPSCPHSERSVFMWLQQLMWSALSWLHTSGSALSAEHGATTCVSIHHQELQLRPSRTSTASSRWIYLPQPAVHLILEFAMFLW